MREALEAVAEFLAHHGALDDYDAILQSMHKMGWEIEEDRPARWRSFLAVMRAELSVVDEPINYVFLFERLLQLYVRIPIDICRRLFASKIILHLIVERFAAAFENIDAEVFKLESDILCHTENIYGVCMLIQDKLYSDNNNSSSSLGAFLSEFSALFDDDEPKDAWYAFRREHRLSGTTFRRDMKRALWWIEQQVFGKTEIELLFPTDSVFEKSTTISRRFLETKFGGSSHEWRALSDVFSIPGLGPERPTDTDAIEDDELERRPANKRKRKAKIYWTQPEVDALVKGIKQFGKEHNLWILIKEANPELLRKRTNVDLKDKYRNLVKAGKIPPIGE
ncbi:hypothetical protein Poli38472_003011 [Pythium oligandrum]|uniref:Myb-like domain-containing protein n=1 Tax=Pythium oligandrum TaxID=41045 RepID=A0A8K1C614_PYTOL|nr:hypothetical protein Poli38472_003011 [Pythium oligandrum]|eukprot:TMW57086.1 hypothetical protein Poli38472_003011 [Pythium oligandrum]